MKPIIVLGIDLAGSLRRPTGFCLLTALTAKTGEVFSDEEILAVASPDVQLVTIDAPLSLPWGRCCLRSDCTCAGTAHFRECDLELRTMRIKFFPITLGPMRMLTERGLRIMGKFRELGLEVVETFPGGAQDIWGIPRQKDRAALRRGLKRLGVKGDIGKRGVTVHELDAISCALVARLHVQDKSHTIGNPDEGIMILPRPRRRRAGS